MAAPAEWVPNNVNVDVPSAARVYDFLLGGAHNFDIDRIVGKKVLEVLPGGRQVARSNRAFLNRAVRYLMANGITQFLDLGSGIPTVGNVHEVAQRANPDARVVYVDYDAVAVAHSQLMLQGNHRALVVDADLCQPDVVLNNPAVREFLDFDRPIALLMVAVFHFVPDEKKPRDIVARYRSAMPPGSLVALSHLTGDAAPLETAGVAEIMKNSRDPMYFRTYDEVVSLFDGMDVVDPGVVSAALWHPDENDDTTTRGVYVGVGRVR